MNTFTLIHNAIKKIEEAAGCVCFLASESEPRTAMYARLYWEESKPCSGVIWANGNAWAVLPECKNKDKAALLDVIEALPRKEIYEFINEIEREIIDGGRVEFSKMVDGLRIHVSWSDKTKWEFGIGSDIFYDIPIESMVYCINADRKAGGVFLIQPKERVEQ